MTSEQNIDSIFGAAVEIPSEEERRKFLQEICGQNVELRNRIEQTAEGARRGRQFYAGTR